MVKSKQGRHSLVVSLGNWIAIKDGDPRAVAIYNRHYSARTHGTRKLDRVRSGFSGSGQSLTLMTVTCDALFNWRWQQFHKDGQGGVNCTVFRNESNLLSSDLIKEADELAWVRWPDELRHYTYVNSDKIRSVHPGYCFIKAGWDYQRDTLGNIIKSPQGLHLLEIYK